MKKIFLVALAAIGMTACMQDEVVEIANGGAIAFDNAFIGNATRAESVTTDNLETFNVWGKVHGENGSYGVLFNGEPVNKVNGTWTYAETQYWMPWNRYSFAAISPASAVQGDLNASNIIKFTTDGTIDLIYAVEEVQPAATYNDVAFKFEHLLSKVMFSFATDLPAGNEVSIEELQLYTTIEADYDLAGKAWDTSAATKHTWFIDLNANNESEDYFIICFCVGDFCFSFFILYCTHSRKPQYSHNSHEC